MAEKENTLIKIPGEAFTATADVINNIIDKISNAIGWLAVSRGTRENQIEAEKYLIEQIKNDETMPSLAKAACISNARKILKEYKNQHAILEIALNQVNETALPQNVDDDWISMFFDKAKNISRENMAVIWGKLLAKEFNTPNTVSKKLIHILSVIDVEDAEIFTKLSNFTVLIGDAYYPLIYWNKREIYHNNGFEVSKLLTLQNTGLIQITEVVYTTELEDNEKISYFDKNIDVGNVKKVCVGSVILSKAGQELMSIITDRKRVDGFDIFVKKRLVTEFGGLLDGIDEE